MEHIVQFAIGIDDDGIRKRIEENAYNDVVKMFHDSAVETVFGEKRRWYTREYQWEDFIKDGVEQFLDSHRDEIVERAAMKLCEKMSRTKAVREAVKKVVE